MRLYQAIANLCRGFVSLFIKNVSAENPEAVYEGIIQKRKEDREKLLQAAGAVVAERNKRSAELESVSRQLTDLERRLQVAITSNDRPLGSLLLQKKQALESQRTSLLPQVERLTSETDRIKEDIKVFNANLLALMEEAKINVARMRSARATNDILAVIDGLSVRGDDQMLTALRDSIESEIGQVEVRKELDETGDLERRLQSAGREADKLASEQEFEQLRAQYESGQGTHSAKPPSASGGEGKEA